MVVSSIRGVEVVMGGVGVVIGGASPPTYWSPALPGGLFWSGPTVTKSSPSSRFLRFSDNGMPAITANTPALKEEAKGGGGW